VGEDGEPGHSRRLGQADTWLSDTTLEENNALNDIKTNVDIFTSVVYTGYELFVCSQSYADNTIRTVR